MAVYGAFVSSTLGMLSQSHSLNTISSNLANINTGGYKANETRFSTVLSGSLFEQSDLGGIRVKDTQLIDKQGNLIVSDRALDVAISGKGFFILKSKLTGARPFTAVTGRSPLTPPASRARPPPTTAPPSPSNRDSWSTRTDFSSKGGRRRRHVPDLGRPDLTPGGPVRLRRGRQGDHHRHP